MIIVILCWTTPTRAETIELRAPGRLTFQRDGQPALELDLHLEIDRFLTDRRAINYCNTLEKTMRQCTDALGACEIRECEECRPAETPLFGVVGLPALIGTGIAVLAIGTTVGIVIGVEVSRPRTP